MQLFLKLVKVEERDWGGHFSFTFSNQLLLKLPFKRHLMQYNLTVISFIFLSLNLIPLHYAFGLGCVWCWEWNLGPLECSSQLCYYHWAMLQLLSFLVARANPPEQLKVMLVAGTFVLFLIWTNTYAQSNCSIRDEHEQESPQVCSSLQPYWIETCLVGYRHGHFQRDPICICNSEAHLASGVTALSLQH